MSVTTLAPSGARSHRPRHLVLVTGAPSGDRSSQRRPTPASGAWDGSAGSAVGPRGVPGGLRLTRRGRLVVRLMGAVLVAVVLAVVVVGSSLLGNGTAGADDGPVSTVRSTEHVVLPGETLWGIASTWAPEEDPREAVAELVEFNALAGVGVSAGQRLRLPIRP